MLADHQRDAVPENDTYGPDAYGMPAAPFCNSAAEAWSNVRVNTWSNLCGIFCGHDLIGSHSSDPFRISSPASYWKQVPVKSASRPGHTVQQLFANSQQIDAECSASMSEATGAGHTASVFLVSRRPGLGLLEGRMISSHSGNWLESRSASFPGGTSWSASETLLFSVPFTGLGREGAPAHRARD